MTKETGGFTEMIKKLIVRTRLFEPLDFRKDKLILGVLITILIAVVLLIATDMGRK